ncbi:MAG: hypothetical protein QOF89_89 [Acidobacteriota bacterium]|nr:hypothetical protein [Acidobacteriota bacterium]
MSQSNQAVEVEAAVTPRPVLGYTIARFNFPSNTLTQTARDSFNPPSGTEDATIALQSFDLKYTGESSRYDFGRLQVAMSTSNTEASCTATLRDQTDSRKWEGTATGLVTFFGAPA